jgi:hypothetical protein
VYPEGHCALPPPKHRGIPEESTLHTAFMPSQQSCGALIMMIPPSGRWPVPQMFPVPLQACPLSQRPPLQVTVPFGLGPPPQQESVSRQKSPVSRQPPAGWQTVTPVPGSSQIREQQFEPPEQGFPSWMHPPPPPPVTMTQSAAPPDGAPVHPAPQQFPQQSAFCRHTSLSA